MPYYAFGDPTVTCIFAIIDHRGSKQPYIVLNQKKKERNATHEENGDGDRELFGANVLVLILTTIDLKSPAAAAPETRANLCQYYVYGPLRNGQHDRCMWEMWHKL